MLDRLFVYIIKINLPEKIITSMIIVAAATTWRVVVVVYKKLQTRFFSFWDHQRFIKVSKRAIIMSVFTYRSTSYNPCNIDNIPDDTTTTNNQQTKSPQQRENYTYYNFQKFYRKHEITFKAILLFLICMLAIGALYGMTHHFRVNAKLDGGSQSNSTTTTIVTPAPALSSSSSKDTTTAAAADGSTSSENYTTVDVATSTEETSENYTTIVNGSTSSEDIL